MARSEVVEEISALRSIFCNPGEFDLLTPSSLETLEQYHGDISFKLVVQCSANEDSKPSLKSSESAEGSFNQFNVEMSVTLPPSYPRLVPEISLSCTELTKKNVSLLRDRLVAYATKFCTSTSEPIIMDLTLWIQENAGLYWEKPALTRPRNAITAYKKIILLKLDHMRNKTRYVKFISSWAKELELHGRIFFLGHFIFILMTGESENVKEYLHRHKTCNVDVDSSGRPCKERMMNVLFQQEALSNKSQRIGDFQEVECKSLLDFKEKFTEINLAYLFEEHIEPLVT
ncbi:RWD domain-containing protein 3-like [Montipora foliosa]|uniref:RWD domain-containing protein 3-like n=1 Tax=Montipora foliosa TaxID=591990 RepID=UPI0035F15459